ncbi:hypothetical protein RFI_03349 [Reticulomyxa filosa]|uniref:Carbohydrate kinase PfkB domain-containing protein n=1 Tax=Reticulomyxa filosa TaxID=46433 RepID=X6P7Z3_RETFI|nr:hypothetical protein RFI_03349 [Reticulomyxa filosa]|eukprot:ETO33752.1 hypothetical protein RFI_03349 [Reticulomyxa filosa]
MICHYFLNIKKRTTQKETTTKDPILVIKQGEKGALCVQPNGQFVQCSLGQHIKTLKLPVVEAKENENSNSSCQFNVVDTTGAGDAFGGAFIAYWQAHNDLKLALKHAVASGTLNCMRVGACPTPLSETQIALVAEQLSIKEGFFVLRS